MEIKDAILRILESGDQTGAQLIQLLAPTVQNVINGLVRDGKVKPVGRRGHLRLVRYKTVKNLLNPTGPDVILDVDTPLCCDPSSETYHSM